MPVLEDFNFSLDASLADFQSEDNITPPAQSKSSNLNMAAYATALGAEPENVVDTYRLINAEFETSGNSPTAGQLVADSKQKAMQANIKALPSIMADSNLSDEVKKKAALDVLDQQASQYSFRNLLSTEAVAAPVKNESHGAETTRIDLAGDLKRINEIKRQQQIMLNTALNTSKPEFVKSVVDFAGYMVPFAQGKYGADIQTALGEGGVGTYAEGAILSGEIKENLRTMLAQTRPEDRLEMTQHLIDAINNSASIVFSEGNDYAAKDYMQSVLDQGAYDDVDKWIDNASSILDVLGVGGILGKAVKGTKAFATASEAATDLARNTTKRFVKSRVQPTSVGNNYKDTNPDKAKAAFTAAVSDETDEASQALYGANRDDVISDQMTLELHNDDTSVMNKVGEPDRNIQLSQAGDLDLIDFVNNDGKIYFFQSEKASATSHVVTDFEQAIGMNARKEMSQIQETGDGVNIRMMYAPPQSGFTSADDAMAMARWSLRKYGITDDNIKLMARDGDSYKEVDKAAFATGDEFYLAPTKAGKGGKKAGFIKVRKPKDYMIAIDYKHTISPGDVGQWAEADVKYNIFDRLNLFTGSSGAGSLQRHVFDAHSLLHPTITKGATVAVDRSAGLERTLLEGAKRFADKFSKADPEMQGAMRKLIDDANEKGKDFNYNEMIAAGLREPEIDALKAWREHWDNIYRLENRDMAKSLRNNGYMEYVDEVGDTRLIAKPVARNQNGSVGRVYDPTTGEVKRLTDAEVRDLYDRDGTFAKLRAPITIGDEVVEHIVSSQSAGKNYLRGITDNTRVLNYRKGYYSVRYTDPYFIVKRTVDKDGTVRTKAVATAGSRADAEAMAKSKSAADGGEYFTRQDVKDSQNWQDNEWNIHQSSGRSTQRLRGKRLEEPDSYITNPEQSNILDPVDSMIVSARSIAQRTSMRDMLETGKQRFIAQYGEFLPKNEFAQRVFPASVKDIKYGGEQAENAKKLADARTTFEYLRSLESGYINHIDDAYKTALKNIADAAGNAGFDAGDKLARWMASGRGPSAMGKNLAFNMYLATNPARQLIVQSHQAIQLTANFPRWVISGQAAPQVAVLSAYQWGIKPSKQLLKGAGLTEAEANAMYKQFQATGQVAAIDKQNLVQGSLANLADQMSMGRSRVGNVWRVVTSPITVSRKIGFDAGENISTMTSWLAHRDKAIREGKDMARSDVQAEVAALSRNYTYNMNVAGDMPYNQNAWAAVMQFQQVPHKALLGMTTNRLLTPAQKARLFGFNAIMFTLPPAAMYDWFGGVLPEDPTAREAVVQGLEGYALNSLLSAATGEKSTVDWSGLAPVDMYGTFDFLHGLVTGNIGAAIAATPSGQLLFGNNPRLTNFARTTAQYFNLVDDYQDPTTFGQVAVSFAKLSSGLSNSFKANYALEYDKKYGTLSTTNSNIPNPNAIAMALGFNSMEDAQNRYVSNEVYTKSKDFEEDVKKTYKLTKEHYLQQNPNIPPAYVALKIMGEAWRVYGNDNVAAKRIIAAEIKRDLGNKDAQMFQRTLNQNGIFDREEMMNLMNASKFDSEEQRSQAKELVDFMYRYKGE